MQITDEMAILACKAYCDSFKLDGELNPLAMKVALKAVFADIPTTEKKEKKQTLAELAEQLMACGYTNEARLALNAYFEGLDK